MIAVPRGSQACRKSGCTVAPPARGTTPTDIDVSAAPQPIAETDRLGDEIAELFAHLEAAGAHLLDLIREFDARGWAIDVLHPLALKPVAVDK
jgi:hypothetical protein